VVAVIVTVVELETGVVVTVSFAAVAPAGTVIVPDSAATALLLATLTRKPPVGATAFRYTATLVLTPPKTGEGATLTEVTLGGRTTIVVCKVELPDVAVIVTVVEFATGLVVTVAFAALDPAGIVIVGGTVAAALLLATLIWTPPVGAN